MFQLLRTTKPRFTSLMTMRPSFTMNRQLSNNSKGGFQMTPSPPKLSKEEQEEFENLQRIANSQSAIEEYNSKFLDTKESFPDSGPDLKKVDLGGFSPEFMRTIPEFEGDVNPVTGEVGGPKQDPLRHGDYSFNGRVTDF
ncbi:hypothetical protein WICPIJ_009210 [Wickerhamomyces pijperi]|uniref:Succinate dehydrogenase assembly factor 4, mitochondrial n=1 Tax=Wickerhamomyces pijperi TaxID=599730 RepID=A0A9P8TES0_WICPI|nr:hypothetical protein WICPIJ_009210 [Wickerhamomyces pijperi]